MRFIITLLVTALLSGASCKTTKNKSATSNSQTPEKNEQVSADRLCRVRVTFGSIASGINRESKIAFQQYVGNYEERTGKKLAHEITLWGMEGERDYCFKLSELSKKEQQEFIEGLYALSKEKQQLFISENIEARQPRQAPPQE